MDDSCTYTARRISEIYRLLFLKFKHILKLFYLFVCLLFLLSSLLACNVSLRCECVCVNLFRLFGNLQMTRIVVVVLGCFNFNGFRSGEQRFRAAGWLVDWLTGRK